MKKLFLTLCALVMAIPSLWAHSFEVNGIYYNITNSTYKTVSVTYQGSNYNSYSNEYTGSVSIPSSVTYDGTTYSVTSIVSEAFKGCTELSSITIPNSVTSIGGYAFQGCTDLNSITIPNNVTSMGYHVFQGCTGLITVNFNATNCTSMGGTEYPVFSNCTNLSSVKIGENVTHIPSYAFKGCTGLNSVSISNSVTEIGGYAFQGCTGLTSITIPNNITSMGYHVFQDCIGLTTVNFNATNCTITKYPVFSNCTNLSSVNIGENVTHLPSYVFKGCTGLNSVSIPNSVTSIGSEAFQGCTGLTTITIPNNVISIGSSAFQGCAGLTTVNFNATNCTSMGVTEYPVFSNCTNLSSINIGENVTHLPSCAFKGCIGLISVAIPNNIIAIGSYTFNGCWRLTSVTIGNNVTTIGNYAFQDCTGLASVNIPNSVTSIGSYAFYGCTGLTSVTIPNSVTSIDGYAFQGCTGLTSITIPNNITSMGYHVFRGCVGLTTVNFNATNCTSMGGTEYPVFSNCTNLSSINIGENVTYIPSCAFKGCIGLTSITIPRSVNSIGNYAFSSCTDLLEIHVLATTPPNAKSNSFENSYSAHLYVPKGCKNAYQQATGWKNFNSMGSYRYTVTVTSSDESMGSVSGNGIYWEDAEIELIATANEGYEFIQWSDGKTDNPRTLIVTKDITFTAEFGPEGSIPTPYQITLQANDNELGSVIGSGSYRENAIATLMAIPQSGTLFIQWSDGNTDNPRSIIVTNDIALTAQFAQPDYQVTALVNDANLGEVSKAVLLEAIPSSNKAYFQNWSDGSTENPRTIYLTEDITLTANFAVASVVDALDESGIQVYANDGALHIDNAEVGVEVMISDLSGRIIKVCETEAGSTRIALESGIYLVKIAGNTVKVVL